MTVLYPIKFTPAIYTKKSAITRDGGFFKLLYILYYSSPLEPRTISIA